MVGVVLVTETGDAVVAMVEAVHVVDTVSVAVVLAVVDLAVVFVAASVTMAWVVTVSVAALSTATLPFKREL